jgi:tRNA(fMet)-specific endonuclease VapC
LCLRHPDSGAIAATRENAKAALEAIEKTLTYEVAIIGFDEDCARTFGKCRTEMLRRGVDTNPVDLMIASVALVYDLTLVTNNTKDFQNIQNLRCEDWVR